MLHDYYLQVADLEKLGLGSLFTPIYIKKE